MTVDRAVKFTSTLQWGVRRDLLFRLFLCNTDQYTAESKLCKTR